MADEDSEMDGAPRAEDWGADELIVEHSWKIQVGGKKIHPMEIKEAEFPPWLLLLLETKFYGRCVSHYKLENYFCYDCKEAFCEKCEKHTRCQDSHKTLHLYRASWYPTVETKDAKEWLDISDIQTFSINNHEVVYLNLRPRIEKEKESNGRTNLCDTCQRVLKDKDKIRFCSISCKIKGNGLALQQIRGEKRIAAAVDPSTDLPPRRRRRKGVPQRAPFF